MRRLGSLARPRWLGLEGGGLGLHRRGAKRGLGLTRCVVLEDAGQARGDVHQRTDQLQVGLRSPSPMRSRSHWPTAPAVSCADSSQEPPAAHNASTTCAARLIALCGIEALASGPIPTR